MGENNVNSILDNACYAKADYNQVKKFMFNTINEDGKYNNRPINKSSVNTLKKAYTKDKIGFVQPITINMRNQHVLDGQHRLVAFTQLVEENKISADTMIPVKYISVDADVEPKIIYALNSGRQSWSEDNFVKFLSKEKVESYKELEKFAEKYDLCNNKNKNKSWRIATALLNWKKPSKCKTYEEVLNYIEKNPITDEMLEQAKVVVGEIEKIKDAFSGEMDFNVQNLEPMIKTWYGQRKKMSIERWVKEIKRQKKLSDMQPYLKRTRDNKDWNTIWSFILGGVKGEF